MNIEQERHEWNKDASAIDQMVDQVVDHAISYMKNNPEASPASYIAVDTIFRPYVKWLHAAQLNGVPAGDVRDAAIHLIGIIIMEAALRMGGGDENGRISFEEWLSDFCQEIALELEQDVKALMESKGNA